MTLERTRPETCLSDLKLEQLLSEELSGAALQAVQAHLALCQSCPARLDVLRREVAGISSELQKVTPLRAKRLQKAVGPLLALAAGLGAFVVWYGGGRGTGDDGRLKGAGWAMGVVIKRASTGAVERLATGASAAKDDAVRFELSTASAGYFAIAGIDGAGAVELYYPAPGEPMQRLEAGRGQLLQGSVVLDDSAGTQAFVAVRCEQSVAVGELTAAAARALQAAAGDARHLGAVLPACAQDVFLVEKVKAP